jgi:hypothetical protein
MSLLAHCHVTYLSCGLTDWKANCVTPIVIGYWSFRFAAHAALG